MNISCCGSLPRTSEEDWNGVAPPASGKCPLLDMIVRALLKARSQPRLAFNLPTMALSDLGLTEDAAAYILRSYLHAFILEILAYGIYTAVYCVTLYLTCMFSTCVQFFP